jgi:hypothetical protein
MTEQPEPRSAAAASLENAIVAGSDTTEPYQQLCRQDLNLATRC